MTVVWLTLRDDVPPRGMWDQALLEDLLVRLGPVEHCERLPRRPGGAVVVLPGGAHADMVEQVNRKLARLDWCLLIVTSDEASAFPWRDLDHPNLTVWTSYPRSDRHPSDEVRWLPLGYTPHTRPHLDRLSDEYPKPVGWWFAGQATHPRRMQALKAMGRMDGGQAHPSDGFAQGLDHGRYLAGLASAKVAPCPGGIVHPDSFRVWEALEAGAVPVADRQAGEWDVPGDYWTTLCDGPPPFPVIDDWRTLPEVTADLLDAWPAPAVEVGIWWQAYKHRLAGRLRGDLTELGADVSGRPVTAVVTVSPIAAHPSTAIVTATIESIRARLPDVPVVVSCDGVRPGDEHRADDYLEHLRRLTWQARRWRDVRIVWDGAWRHQAATLAVTLAAVDTPLVLMAEHDTPLEGDFDWPGLFDACLHGGAEHIRFHYDHHLHPSHDHMMLDRTPRDVCGVPLIRTVQWSQRPHLAVTGRYRTWLSTYFGSGARTMVEDVMHGVLHNHWREFGLAGWDRFRTHIYHPDGSIRRSTHLDGRAGEPKREMLYAYDTDDPDLLFGAPAPSETS